MAQAASDETARFYSTAHAFHEFLIERTQSSAIVADLAAAFHRGEPLDNWILTRTGRGKRDQNLEHLNADFLAWIASDRRYGGTDRETAIGRLDKAG